MGTTALSELSKVTNLHEVWRNYYSGRHRKSVAGVDGVAPAIFEQNKRHQISHIHRTLLEGYEFSALRGVAIPKKDASKLRLICVPTVADRLVQRAILHVIAAHTKRLGILNEVSYGFVKDEEGSKKGVHGARSRAKKLRNERPWVFKADISRFFDTIVREPLADEFTRSFRLTSLSPLVTRAIGSEVLVDSDLVRAAVSQNDIRKGLGLRQGMPLSPVLSNFVLRNFDRIVSKNYPMVRYADDFILFAADEVTCKNAERLVIEELAKLGLELSAAKSAVVPPEEPVEFLGMELGLRSDGLYRLSISPTQLSAIKQAFQKYHDVGAADADGLDAAELFVRLRQMRAGFGAAYGAADNIKELEKYLDQWQQNCARSVYGSIFGRKAVDALTKAQRRFLMLS